MKLSNPNKIKTFRVWHCTPEVRSKYYQLKQSGKKDLNDEFDEFPYSQFIC